MEGRLPSRRLGLNRETVRELGDDRLTAAGGATDTCLGCHWTPVILTVPPTQCISQLMYPCIP
jgi:hypothetical protein